MTVEREKKELETHVSTNNPTSKQLEEALRKQDLKDKQSGLTTKLSEKIEKAKEPENFFILSFGIMMSLSGLFLGLFIMAGSLERLIVSSIFFIVSMGLYTYRYKTNFSGFPGMTMRRRGGG